MSSLLQAIIACLTGAEPATWNYPDEKEAIFLSIESHTAEAMATDVVEAILIAEKGGKDLQRKIDNIVGAYGWTEKVAEWTLAKLEQALTEASKLGPVVKEAYDKACEVAIGVEGFVKDHPVMCTVMALGVLVILAPWAIEALGFAELGPVEGSFAALWQARYAGFVPKGSLFSFFQRLGMTWHILCKL